MYKCIFIWFFIIGSFTLSAQRQYVCEFTDTITAVIPDSVFADMLINTKPDIEIPPEVMKQFLSQVKQKPLSMIQTRMVRAEIDRTVISIDRSSKAGNLTMETFDSILYKNDEIFLDSASVSGFAKSPLNRPRKQFVATGKRVNILNYACDEYLSTDSTCYMWVTSELPDYVNPGIRKGNIQGAVLGFELKEPASTTKTILVRFGRGL